MRQQEMSSEKPKGDIFVVSAPSGAGKSTLCRRLLSDLTGVGFSVSHTTRQPRQGETDGIQYHFVTRNRFEEMIGSGDFLEWAKVHGNFYGTSRQSVEAMLNDGMDVLLDVDVAGAKVVKELFPESQLIFIMPPSLQALRDRLAGRGTDLPEVISLRLENARVEMAQAVFFDYAVINDDLEKAYQEFRSVFVARRQRLARIRIERPELFCVTADAAF